MKHIKPISEPCLRQSLAHGGCGECQSSCQSAWQDQLHRSPTRAAPTRTARFWPAAMAKVNHSFGK